MGAPAVQRRAPLRRGCPRRGRGDWCSRRSTAGSIAARRPGRGRSRPASCSRRSTAGSIAASAAGRGVADAWVLPPFTGGLHCGVDASAVIGTRRRRCSRRSTAGSIAAWLGARCARLLGAPAVQRRAPLRRVPGAARRRPDGAPAVQRRAPLRRVAAAVLPGRRGRAPAVTGGLHCGRAGVSDPAPMPGAPAFTGGLHCGKPARPAYGSGPVLPPFNGGLHCGAVPRIDAAAAKCSRRSPAGSIAAGGPRPAGGSTGSAPAVQRRAPLRRRR